MAESDNESGKKRKRYAVSSSEREQQKGIIAFKNLTSFKVNVFKTNFSFSAAHFVLSEVANAQTQHLFYKFPLRHPTRDFTDIHTGLKLLLKPKVSALTVM
jgi:hypothetical protein